MSPDIGTSSIEEDVPDLNRPLGVTRVALRITDSVLRAFRIGSGDTQYSMAPRSMPHPVAAPPCRLSSVSRRRPHPLPLPPLSLSILFTLVLVLFSLSSSVALLAVNLTGSIARGSYSANVVIGTGSAAPALATAPAAVAPASASASAAAAIGGSQRTGPDSSLDRTADLAAPAPAPSALPAFPPRPAPAGQRVDVIVDTGSSALVVGLRSCATCTEMLARYDVNASATAEPVRCASGRCDAGTCDDPTRAQSCHCSPDTRACCSQQTPNDCGFSVEYGDGALGQGRLVTDLVNIAGVVAESGATTAAVARAVLSGVQREFGNGGWVCAGAWIRLGRPKSFDSFDRRPSTVLAIGYSSKQPILARTREGGVGANRMF